MSICYIPRNSVGKCYRFHSFYIEFIGFTYGIPRYVTDSQNYIGCTYKSPITYLYLFTVYMLYTTVCVIHGYLKVCMQFGLHTIILFSTSSHLLWAVFGMMFVVSLWRIATTFPEYRLICSELWCKTSRRISSFFWCSM